MNRPYSEATRDKIAQVLWDMATDGAQHRGRPTPTCHEDARAVLDALAAAGLLLPEGAETRTEWGTRITWDDGTVAYQLSLSEAHAQQRVAMHAEKRATRPGWRATADLISRDIRTGPWVLVDAVRLAEGESQ